MPSPSVKVYTLKKHKNCNFFLSTFLLQTTKDRISFLFENSRKNIEHAWYLKRHLWREAQGQEYNITIKPKLVVVLSCHITLLSWRLRWLLLEKYEQIPLSLKIYSVSLWSSVNLLWATCFGIWTWGCDSWTKRGEEAARIWTYSNHSRVIMWGKSMRWGYMREKYPMW